MNRLTGRGKSEENKGRERAKRQWLERPTGLRRVDSRQGVKVFALSHARNIENISPFLISSPILKFTILLKTVCFGKIRNSWVLSIIRVKKNSCLSVTIKQRQI